MVELELAPGAVVAGKYVVRARIGEGGMGVVYEADQPALARSVAIKLIRRELAANPAHVRRFREEAIAASRVAHPNTVAVIDRGETPDGTAFIVMELVRGRSLRELARGDRGLEVPRLLLLVDQVLAGLGAAHAEGVVHADIKPDNILVEVRHDGTDHVKIADFGLARMHDRRADRTSERTEISGTPEYIAPEVVRGERPTPASDLYGVGIILYELLTGATPFVGGSAQDIMRRQVDDLVVPPSLRRPSRNISLALDRVVLRALAKDPRERFADAAMFSLAIRSAMRAHARVSLPDRCRACGKRGVAADARFCMTCGAPARVTPVRSFAAEVPTSVETPRPPRDLALGSSSGDPAQLGPLRSAIGVAIRGGDATAIATAYIAFAAELTAASRYAAAVDELEEGIMLLAPDIGPDEVPPSEAVARLLVTLAAVYTDAGDRAQAERIAASVDRYGTLPAV